MQTPLPADNCTSDGNAVVAFDFIISITFAGVLLDKILTIILNGTPQIAHLWLFL